MTPDCQPTDPDICPMLVVCRCLQVTEAEVVAAIESLELRTLKDVRRHTGAGDGCTACHKRLRTYLERHAGCAEPLPGRIPLPACG
jgi:bacterioferritin-associated ferredoxin